MVHRQRTSGSHRPWHVVLGVLMLCVGALLGLDVLADEVPADKQALILLRALAYDRVLPERAGDAVVVAILHPPGQEGASDTKAALAAFKALEKITVGGKPFRAVTLAYSGAEGLAGAVQSQGIDAIYISSALGSHLSQILAITQSKQVLSMAGSRELAVSGASLAVALSRGKPTVLVNLPSSKAEGAQFRSDLLQLAEVLR